MQTPQDLRHFDPAQHIDAFQILTPQEAKFGLLCVLLFVWAILPVLK